ncbi:MAG: c-type cytochrome [Planctomycetota bacterium]
MNRTRRLLRRLFYAASRPRNGAAWVLACSILSGCGWTPPGKPDPRNRPLAPTEVLDFTTLYQKNCSGCHGAEGKLGVAPPLNDPLFLAIIPKDELGKVIDSGRLGTMMPAFARANGGHLTPEQVRVLAEGIVSTWGKKEGEGPDVSKVPSYLAPGSTTQGSAEAGAAVFARACANCHGEQGKGGERAGALNVPAFLALSSDQFLRRIVITGRPDLGMPGFERKKLGGNEKSLTDQEIADVVAYLASWRRPVTAMGP